MKRIWSKTTDRSGAKDWRKPWQGEKKSRNVDRSCRHGGNCAYCQENREFRATRQLESTEDQIMERFTLPGKLPPGFVEDGWPRDNLLRIRTPFLTPNGENIDVFVEQSLGGFVISDQSNCHTYLFHSVVEVDHDLATQIASAIGVRWDSESFSFSSYYTYLLSCTHAIMRVAMAQHALIQIMCREDEQ